jgi:putative ABC transport system permease protein
LVYRLVFENFRHRPVRTLLSAFLIGVMVTLILTLVGLAQGMLRDLSERNRGTGADIMIRPPNSSLLAFTLAMPEKIVTKVRAQPHVALATGTFIHQIDAFGDFIAGIHLNEFNVLSGGLTYVSGRPFSRPDDLVIDTEYARSKHLQVGDTLDLGVTWHIVGVIEAGKGSRAFSAIGQLQELYSGTGTVNVIWVKADDPANIPTIINSLKENLPDYKVDSMEQYLSLLSVDAIPLLKPFTNVVVGVGVLVGFLVVCLSMYTAVLERTREIGILKALGASPAYILGVLMRETALLALVGAILGIIMSYGARGLLRATAPTMTMAIAYSWWPGAFAVALAGSLLGALFPGLKAARQDAIEALSYD